MVIRLNKYVYYYKKIYKKINNIKNNNNWLHFYTKTKTEKKIKIFFNY